jgi:ribosome-binding ATPase
MVRLKQLEYKGKLDKKLAPAIEYIKALLAHLESEKPAREFEHVKDEIAEANRSELFLITDKPVIFLVNTEDDRKDESVKHVQSIVGETQVVMGLDVKQEYELASMSDEERSEFMKDLGIERTGLEELSMLAYKTLGLISYFTAGPMEARAWTIVDGMNAQQAAGEIHTDIMNNFIAADVCNWKDFVDLNGWVGAKEKGKVSLQGKTYIVKDGDVMLFKHNG